MSQAGGKKRSAGRAARCPICDRSRAHGYRPFCSARCRDVDLGRWFGEVYAVPAVEPGDDADEPPDAPAGDRGQPS